MSYLKNIRCDHEKEAGPCVSQFASGCGRSTSHLGLLGTPSRSETIVSHPPKIEGGDFNARSLERDAFSADREADSGGIYRGGPKRDKAPELEENGEGPYMDARLMFLTISERIFYIQDVGEHW